MRNILIIFLLLTTNQAWGKCILKIEHEKTIKQIARRYNVNYLYMIKIAKVESNFNHNVIKLNKNQTIDVGMFQINSSNWQGICKGLNIFTFHDNTECAIKIVNKIQKKYSLIDNMWIGRYHSNTLKYKVKYYNKIINGE